MCALDNKLSPLRAPRRRPRDRGGGDRRRARRRRRAPQRPHRKGGARAAARRATDRDRRLARRALDGLRARLRDALDLFVRADRRGGAPRRARRWRRAAPRGHEAPRPPRASDPSRPHRHLGRRDAHRRRSRRRHGSRAPPLARAPACGSRTRSSTATPAPAAGWSTINEVIALETRIAAGRRHHHVKPGILRVDDAREAPQALRPRVEAVALLSSGPGKRCPSASASPCSTGPSPERRRR